MASILYTSSLEDLARGAIDFDTDTFYAMLVAPGFTENKNTQLKRSDVTASEVTGAGYTAGGIPITATVNKDTGNSRLDVTFASVNWPASTISARGMVIYKRRGGAATADELVMYDDFGSTISSSSGTFTVQQNVYRLAN